MTVLGYFQSRSAVFEDASKIDFCGSLRNAHSTIKPEASMGRSYFSGQVPAYPSSTRIETLFERGDSRQYFIERKRIAKYHSLHGGIVRGQTTCELILWR